MSSRLPPLFSGYLDLVRFLAALVVLLEHFSLVRFTGGTFSSVGSLGHEAVMLFFVLSGYVIAYSADARDATSLPFLSARLAKLWSALLPALVLGIVLDLTGSALNTDLYAGKIVVDYWPIKLLVSAFFLQETWVIGSKFGTNGPLWSLGYEFLYYVFFSIFLGRGGWLLKTVLVMACLCLAGPKIVLLLPVWLLGVAVYKAHCFYKDFTQVGAVAILFLSFIALGMISVGNSAIVGWLQHEFDLLWEGSVFAFIDLRFSRGVVSDYALGLAFAAHLFSIRYLLLSGGYQFNYRGQGFDWVTLARNIGDFTYPLYVLHVPMLYFIMTLLQLDAESLAHNGVLFFLTIFSVVGLNPAIKRFHGCLLRRFGTRGGNASAGTAT